MVLRRCGPVGARRRGMGAGRGSDTRDASRVAHRLGIAWPTCSRSPGKHQVRTWRTYAPRTRCADIRPSPASVWRSRSEDAGTERDRVAEPARNPMASPQSVGELDMSERRFVERELTRHAERYRVLVEAISTVVRRPTAMASRSRPTVGRPSPENPTATGGSRPSMPTTSSESATHGRRPSPTEASTTAPTGFGAPTTAGATCGCAECR